MTDGQELALEQLREMSAVGAAVELVAVHNQPDLGRLHVEVSLDCSEAAHAEGGIVLRARERFSLLIPPDSPFPEPSVRVSHTRWAGTAHVQWGHHLCLYAAPSIQWVPADGMHGLIDRLLLWLELASLGQLDPDDQPLHPPVAYAGGAGDFIVVRADLGDKAPPPQAIGRGRPATEASLGAHEYRIAVARCEIQSARRMDVVEWVEPREWLRRCVNGELEPVDGVRSVGALVLLADAELSFEYPNRVELLLLGLDKLGAPREEFLSILGLVAAANSLLRDSNEEALPLRVLIGTPSRRKPGGPVRSHLVCWQVDDLGRQIAEDLPWTGSQNETLAELARRVNALVPDWVRSSSIDWIRVLEARSEITERRDRDSPTSWVRGKRVMVLGCGALGAPVAEFCVRGGASEVIVVDKDDITPGILVRQPYADADIGKTKALVLADRLNTIRTDQPVRPWVGAVEQFVLAKDMPPPPVDIVIDATANVAVAALLELRRSPARTEWPPVMTMMVGHDARRGVVTISPRGATGAGRDILRRLMLECRRPAVSQLADVADDFFPVEPRSLFQPEPGCSQPTFTGSSAELSALAGLMLDAGARALVGADAGGTPAPMEAAILRLASEASTSLPQAQWLSWPNDRCFVESGRGYEVRLSHRALSEIRSECRRNSRLFGVEVETGGLLLGRLDDACRCVWVDEAIGPPPDSRLSASHFNHGIDGIADAIEHYRRQSGKETTYLGMWHSHPNGVAKPSPTDEASTHQLVAESVGGPPRALMLILGGQREVWRAWLEAGDAPDMFARLISRQILGPSNGVPLTLKTQDQSGWPGGWTAPRRSPDVQRKGFLKRLLRLSRD